MIDFTTVSREIRSVVSRRRDLLTFLGTTFAAVSIFLHNVLEGNLPPSLKSVQAHIFAAYAILLLVPSLILALRLARLNGGMVLNGILYRELVNRQTFVANRAGGRGGPRLFSVSFLMFLLVDLIAGFAAALLILTLQVPAYWAPIGGAVVALLWLLLYFRFQSRAAAFARKKADTELYSPFDRNEWEAHLAGSLQDANHDMIGVLGLVGLMVFSCFQGLTSLGKVTVSGELSAADLLAYGPLAYGLLMVVTSVLGLFTYLRLRVAIGQLSLQSDPTDRPFRPLRLTDSLLGYMLLAFLFAISLHMLLSPVVEQEILLGIDAAAFLAAVLLEQGMLVLAGRWYPSETMPPAAPTPTPSAPSQEAAV